MVDAYLSAATVHAVLHAHTNEREVVGSLIDALQFQGFGEVSVAPAEPTIDDVFVSLVPIAAGNSERHAEFAAAAVGRSRAERRNSQGL